MTDRETLLSDGLKRCSRCREIKKLDTFTKNKSTIDGLCSQCKPCTSLSTKEYRIKNNDSLKDRKAKYYKDNSININARRKVYRDAHPDVMKQQSMTYRKNNINAIKVRKASYYQENKKQISRDNCIDRRDNPGKWAMRGVVALQNTVSFKTYGHRLTVDEKPLDQDGKLSVVCKKCGERFNPLRGQVRHRIACLEGKGAGEANFYCSDNCKNTCPVYHFDTNRTDPRSDQHVTRTEQQTARGCQTNDLKQLQCDHYGYNYCERCGDIIDVDLHHTHTINKTGYKSINSAGHMLLCVQCHIKTHEECK